MTTSSKANGGGYSALRVEDHGAVRAVILDRPEHRNSLDLVIRRELGSALRAADADPSVRSILLAGSGRVFCAGGDIKSMSADPQAARSRLELVGEVARSLVESETPVVAAVQGGAWGAGLALACGCDVVVAGESARFVASFGRLGLVGDTGIFYTLRRRVTAARAREILLLNAELSAAEAVSVGLATRVVADAAVWEEGLSTARAIGAAAPGTNACTKRLTGQQDREFESVLADEIDAQVSLLGSPAFAEGQRAFLEKRDPHWWDEHDERRSPV